MPFFGAGEVLRGSRLWIPTRSARANARARWGAVSPVLGEVARRKRTVEEGTGAEAETSPTAYDPALVHAPEVPYATGAEVFGATIMTTPETIEIV